MTESRWNKNDADYQVHSSSVDRRPRESAKWKTTLLPNVYNAIGWKARLLVAALYRVGHPFQPSQYNAMHTAMSHTFILVEQFLRLLLIMHSLNVLIHLKLFS